MSHGRHRIGTGLNLEARRAPDRDRDSLRLEEGVGEADRLAPTDQLASCAVRLRNDAGGTRNRITSPPYPPWRLGARIRREVLGMSDILLRAQVRVQTSLYSLATGRRVRDSFVRTASSSPRLRFF